MTIDELREHACNGDKLAESKLFKLLNARFTVFARLKIQDPNDREEVVQNALATVFSKYCEVEIQYDFAAWLHKILENKILDFYRQKKRRRQVFTGIPEEFDPVDNHSDNPVFRKALLACFKSILKNNQRYARLIVLRSHGFSFSEICSRLNVTKSNSYSILSRARSMLLACLKRSYFDEQ